jgi:hypothetical protein
VGEKKEKGEEDDDEEVENEEDGDKADKDKEDEAKEEAHQLGSTGKISSPRRGSDMIFPMVNRQTSNLQEQKNETGPFHRSMSRNMVACAGHKRRNLHALDGTAGRGRKAARVVFHHFRRST